MHEELPSEAVRPSILGADSPNLDEFLRARDDSPFRAAQIREWLFSRKIRSFDEMTNLSRDLRRTLETTFRIFSSSVVEVVQADDSTDKVLIGLEDGERIESVLIREGARSTACVSTQVGCPVGCPFCASGLDGTIRNLRAHEIVEQVLLLDRHLPEGRLTHLVLMGIGEPLLNFEAVDDALSVLHASDGYGLGARRITLSTVGPGGKLTRLDRLRVPVNLAISLHAPDDELRRTLVPGSAAIVDLVQASRRYAERTGREVTYEYVLLDEVNAAPEQAGRLARLLRTMPCTVNLIPFNPVSGTPYRPPDRESIHEFRRILEGAGVKVTIRKRKGRRIEAACGQLRLNRIRGTGP